LTAGQHWEFALSAGPQLAVNVAAGEVGLGRLRISPGPLLDLAAAEIAAVRPLLNGALTVGLQQLGYTTKEAARAVDLIVASPRQIQEIAVTVDGEPRDFANKGIDVAITATALPGTDFAAYIAAIQAGETGAPQLAEPAALNLAIAMTPDSLRAAMAPFEDLGVRFVQAEDGKRERARAIWHRTLALYDGTLAMALSPTFEMTILAGVVDAAKARELVASDDYVQQLRDQRFPDRDLEIEVTPKAMTHRGVELLRSKLTGAEPSAWMPTGELVTHFGVAANYLLGTSVSSAGAAQSLVDAALDDKVRRARLPDGAFAQVIVDVQALLRAVNASAGRGASAEPPASPVRTARATLARTGGALVLRVHLQ
jgi:hypothetical protein